MKLNNPAIKARVKTNPPQNPSETKNLFKHKKANTVVAIININEKI